ncbi:tetratricopeptide repeat protein [Haliscomenobacter sp.]|uniref:tetratricopeptide repeat protein n=1 Tax=Haliscomenobacter sp. TaxID=2717303 RepID=UPI0035934A6B
MMTKKVLLLPLLLFCFLSLQAQQTAVYTEANRAFKRGVTLYEQGVLAKAKREFQKAIDLSLPVNETVAEGFRTRAALYMAKCAVELRQKEGEIMTMDFIRSYRPDPEYQEALMDMGNYYFNVSDYAKALEFYNEVPTLGMSKSTLTQMRFRQGYANFASKEFNLAKSFFRDVIAEADGDYYAPANYYMGLSSFFEGDYAQAATSLQIVENNPTYRPYIPFYLTQILFAQKKYQDVIAYAEPKANDKGIRDLKEIQQLVGQSYFELGNYQRALPYLEYYQENSKKLREEELYQIGYTQYQTGNFQKAIQTLKPLSGAESPIGQNAMFYLADCYLKVNQKNNALNALAAAKRLNFDPLIKEEATFNYAKLAYELNQPREAVANLTDFAPNSRYYQDAQRLLADVLLNYRDYQQALEIINDIRRRNGGGLQPQMQATYQKVAVNRGLQLLQNNENQAAREILQKSLENPLDMSVQAVALFWLGDVAHREKNYQESAQFMDRFLGLSRSISNLPEESSVATANYIQGYNLIKQDNYERARGFFQATVDGINRNRSQYRNDKVANNVLGDATLRLGDSYFKFNQYDNALRYYNEAIDRKYGGFDYAIYQKAIIEGLRGRRTEEIAALERLTRDFPGSEFADDALLRIGQTYQEIGRANDAIPHLQNLVTKYRGKSPLVNQGFLALGLINYNAGNYDGAINYYKQVFKNSPEANEANLARASLEEIYVKDLGKPGEYFAFLETIPGYKVDNLKRDSINFRAAEIKYENADYPRAIEGFTSYIRSFSQGLYLPMAYFHRGDSYVATQQYSLALKDYDWIIQQGAGKFYVKGLEKGAVIAYNHELDFNKAFKYYSDLEKASTDENIIFEAQLGAMRSAYRAGNKSAVAALAQKVASNPRANASQIATANFYIGKQAFDNNDFTNALPALQKVVQTSDNEQTAEARYLIAFINYKQRNLDRAQQLCLEANQKSSAYPFWVAKSVLLLADVFADKGDLYNAKAALEALLENFDDDKDLVNTAKTRLAQINKQIEASSPLNKTPESNVLEFQKSGGGN